MTDDLKFGQADLSMNAEPRSPRTTPGYAALLSAVLPGTGQLLLDQRRRGIAYLSLSTLWVALFFYPARLPQFYWGWISLIFAGWILTVVASCEALLGRHAERSSSRWFWLFGALPLALITTLICQALLLRSAGFRAFRIPSSSMERTVQRGDLLMADMHVFRRHLPKDGDIIILRSPNTPGVILIKRLIATGGETIMSQNGDVSLNGRRLREPYVEHIGSAPDELMNFGPVTIPADKLFVMGDNRDVSLDSRVPEFGLIDDSAVLGRALYVITPANNRNGKRLY